MTTATGRQTVEVWRADGVPYAAGLAWQTAAAERVRERRDAGGGGEALALIQHQPVYTMGARGGRTNLLAPLDHLEARGAEVVDTDRGGDITFHGPGQLVAYPILDLHGRRLHAGEYVRALEACVARTLAAYGIEARSVPGRPGVWVGPAKVAAIGVRIDRGVSRHGLALNVDTDLSWFEAIVPCGLADATVTSMERLLGGAPAFDEVVGRFREAFAGVFDCDVVDGARLDARERGGLSGAWSDLECASTGSGRTEPGADAAPRDDGERRAAVGAHGPFDRAQDRRAPRRADADARPRHGASVDGERERRRDGA